MTEATSADLTKEAGQSAADQRAREVFIAAKSHDLRTPINAIIGYSQLLLENAQDNDEPWAKDLEKISSAGRSLLATVNETLSAEKVESGELDMSDVASLGERIRLELRKDISAVVGYAEMLIEDEAELDKGAISDLERIKTSAMRMTDLINDIIAVGTDEAGIADTEGACAGPKLHPCAVAPDSTQRGYDFGTPQAKQRARMLPSTLGKRGGSRCSRL